MQLQQDSSCAKVPECATRVLARSEYHILRCRSMLFRSAYKGCPGTGALCLEKAQ